MKQTFKNYFKLGILLFGISLSLVNCQKDDVLSQVQENSTDHHTFEHLKINSTEIFSNEQLKLKLEQLEKKKSINLNFVNNKEAYSSEYDFTINTSEASYIESQDGLYHSYTFLIERDYPTDTIENLFISLQNDGTYRAVLVSYDLSIQEMNDAYNGHFVNFDEKASYTELDFSSIEFSMVQDYDTVIYYCTEGNHAGGMLNGEACPAQGAIYIFSGGGTGTGSTGTGNTGGDSSGSGSEGGGGTGVGESTSNTNITTPVIGDPTLKKDIIDQCFGFLIDDSTALTQTQQNWLDNDATWIVIKSIALYIEENGCSIESREFIIQAIEALMSENGIEDEILFILETNCNTTNEETTWTNNLEDIEEPKWGQLANKNEILNEISNVSGLSTLSYNDQIIALASHFERNLMYTRVNGELTVVNSSMAVNRYIYSEVGGWIDFHHVFKIFEWATQNGPFTAITMGEMGEMWQSLKDNNSAYSYEDLPSNYLGVAMYLRFSQDLALGNITWHDAVQISLNEINCVEPEEAPNFDYIPHIVNDHYPQNFTYSPLLGDDLKNLHRSKFCERPFNEQVNIKEAHENFPR